MTDIEAFEKWYHNNDFEGGYQDGFRLWQARGRLDAERIAELKQERNDLNYLAMERLHEIEALSLKNQVLREALKNLVSENYTNPTTAEVGQSCSHGKYYFETCKQCADDYINEALNSTN